MHSTVCTLCPKQALLLLLHRGRVQATVATTPHCLTCNAQARKAAAKNGADIIHKPAILLLRLLNCHRCPVDTYAVAAQHALIPWTNLQLNWVKAAHRSPHHGLKVIIL
jgi:hypothetical protein